MKYSNIAHILQGDQPWTEDIKTSRIPYLVIDLLKHTLDTSHFLPEQLR